MWLTHCQWCSQLTSVSINRDSPHKTHLRHHNGCWQWRCVSVCTTWSSCSIRHCWPQHSYSTLHISHHVKGMTLCWFESYLRERYQAVTYAGITAPATMVAHGIPQGSVFGPLQFIFIMYIADIPCIVNGHQLMCICYANTHQKISKNPVVKAWLKTALAASTVACEKSTTT